ncbi:MAG: dicarboxylate/amino acid:cation symporter [Bacteroidetes bacterium]|nr:dicarboxylate/amino acid:cation symporter [Bacteroidota bacterium]
MPWYRKLHWQIMLGLTLGIAYGILAASNGWGEFVNDWIAPFGTIFINGLRLIAVPLVLASLVMGVASLSDLRKLSRIGGKTIGIYLVTTAVAITIGLVIVNVMQPGEFIPPELRDQLMSTYADDAAGREVAAGAASDRGPLQFMVDMVPSNFFAAASNNRNMLQVVMVALFLGIGLIQLTKEKAKPLLDFFGSLNDVIIRLVDVIMMLAPVGVFALIAATITSVTGDDPSQVIGLLSGLGVYCIAVLLGLTIQTVLVYPTILKLFSPMGLKTFFSGIGPAQLVEFSPSSSGATLPVTMERCEEKLGISEEVSSFVLPLGATINMDGTAMYQAIAAVFIAQALDLGLGFGAQLTIILTALLASIGTAAVPGAGIIMLVIILEAIGVPTAGIALILGVDRILDMCRTVTNITGDATVATVVAASEGQLSIPNLSLAGDHIRMTAPS